MAVSIVENRYRASSPRDRKHRRQGLLNDRHEDLLRCLLIEAVLLDVGDDAVDRSPGA